jgi:hypothetical protein
MADIIGSYERLPNDAVRAVAVAKRREYLHFDNSSPENYEISSSSNQKDKLHQSAIPVVSPISTLNDKDHKNEMLIFSREQSQPCSRRSS